MHRLAQAVVLFVFLLLPRQMTRITCCLVRSAIFQAYERKTQDTVIQRAVQVQDLLFCVWHYRIVSFWHIVLVGFICTNHVGDTACLYSSVLNSGDCSK